MTVYGRLAQLVEQLTLNQRVRGSNPRASTTLILPISQGETSFCAINTGCLWGCPVLPLLLFSLLSAFDVFSVWGLQRVP